MVSYCADRTLSIFSTLQSDRRSDPIIIVSHIHVRHIEPNWTCLWARFTSAANAFAVHWTGQVKITTVPNQTEPGPVKITPIVTYCYYIR